MAYVFVYVWYHYLIIYKMHEILFPCSPCPLTSINCSEVAKNIAVTCNIQLNVWTKTTYTDKCIIINCVRKSNICSVQNSCAMKIQYVSSKARVKYVWSKAPSWKTKGTLTCSWLHKLVVLVSSMCTLYFSSYSCII